MARLPLHEGPEVMFRRSEACSPTATNPETIGFIEHSMVGATGIEPVAPACQIVLSPPRNPVPTLGRRFGRRF